MHTHLFPPQFSSLSVWGIDELLTYHYLLAEFFRSSEITPEEFYALDRQQQADLVWQTLFVSMPPVSEAAAGVVGVLTALGLDPRAPDLREAREFFRAQDPEAHLDMVLKLAGVTEIVMTNDPFDPVETGLWEDGVRPDNRFRAALRLDVLLNDWPKACMFLREHGYSVAPDLSGTTGDEVLRFLEKWTSCMEPLYAAASVSDEFTYPDPGPRCRLLTEFVLPFCRDHKLPFALMMGVRRQTNPRLRLAGDALGRSDLRSLAALCADWPEVRFPVTVLSRENQHELCVLARKFSNLLPFGCWWFVNNASIVTEIMRERLEMLGTSFIPQHSDARVLEQLVYKWRHSRRAIGEALAASYAQLNANGYGVTESDVERDLQRLFVGNYRQWLAPARPEARLI